MIRINNTSPGEAPTDEQIHERQERQSQNKVVRAKINEIKQGKVDGFLDDAREHDGGFFDRMRSKAREWYDTRKEDVADAREGMQTEARWYLMGRGATFSLDSAIAKQELRMATIRDQQRREEKKFEDLEKQFEDGKKDIRDSKKKHVETYNKKLKDAEEKHKALRKELEEKQQEIQGVKDKLNDRITKKIAAIKLESNYPTNKEEQKRLKEEIEEIEAEIEKQTALHDKFSAISERLYGGSMIRKFFGKARSENAIFDEQLEDPNAVGLTPEQKKDIEEANKRAAKANGDIKSKMDNDKMSLESVATDAAYALKFHSKELETLKGNLRELKAAKDKIDNVVVHSERRMQSWEQHRRKLGIEDEDPGESVKAEKFADIAALDGSVNDLLAKIGTEKAVSGDPEYWANLNSSKTLIGLDSADKVKKHRVDSKVDKDQIAFSLSGTRENMDSLAFEIDQTLERIESTLQEKGISPAFKKRLEENKATLLDAKNNLSKNYVGKIDEDPEMVKKNLEDAENRAIRYEALFDLAKDAGENEPVSPERNEKIFEFLDYSIESIDEVGSPEDKIRACIATIKGIDGMNLDSLGITEQQIGHITLKLYEKATQEMANVNDVRGRMEIGGELLATFDQQGDLVPYDLFDTVRDTMFDSLVGNIESLSEQDRNDLCGKFFSAVEMYSQNGKFDAMDSLQQCVELRRQSFECALNSAKDPVSAVRQMADISFLFASTLKNTAPETRKYAGFYRAMDFARGLAGDQEGADLNMTDVGDVGNIGKITEMANSNGSGAIGVEKKAQQVEAVNYIQSKLLEAGLDTVYGSESSPFSDISGEEIEDFMQQIDGLASIKTDDINHYVQMAINLEFSGHLDNALKVVDKIDALSAGNTEKLLELATSLSSSHREPIRNEGMEAYEKAFALASQGDKSAPMAWNIIGSMMRDGFVERADAGIAELRNKKKGDFSEEILYPVMLHELVSGFVHDGDLSNKIKEEADTMFMELYESSKGDSKKMIQVAAAMDKAGQSEAAMQVVEGDLRALPADEMIEIPGMLRELQSTPDAFIPSDKFNNEIAASIAEEAKQRFSPEELVGAVNAFSENNFPTEENAIFEHFDSIITESRGRDELYPIIKALAESDNNHLEHKADMAVDELTKYYEGDFDALMEMSSKLARPNQISIRINGESKPLFIEPLYQARMATRGNYENLIKFADLASEYQLSSNRSWLGAALLEAGAIARKEDDQRKIEEVAEKMRAARMDEDAEELLAGFHNEQASQERENESLGKFEANSEVLESIAPGLPFESTQVSDNSDDSEFTSEDLADSTDSYQFEKAFSAESAPIPEPETPPQRKGILSTLLGAFFGFLGGGPAKK